MEREYLNLDVYKKGMEIVHITKALVDSFDEKKDELKLGSLMMTNAYLIPAKIVGAEAAELYSLKMENAMLIKISARELLAQTSLCKHMKLHHKDHLQVLRNEIENFRILFIEWVGAFDKENDIKDGWAIL